MDGELLRLIGRMAGMQTIRMRSIAYRRMAERADTRWAVYIEELATGKWSGVARIELLTYARDAAVAKEMALAQLGAARGNGFCPCCGLVLG